MNRMPSSISPEESQKFPVTTLLIALAILAAAAAVLVFNVPVGKVLTYGFFALMMFSHFFMMRGAHDGHNHGESRPKQSSDLSHSAADPSQMSDHNPADDLDGEAGSETNSKKDHGSHQGHSGCC